jgi:hypothetical protein
MDAGAGAAQTADAVDGLERRALFVELADLVEQARRIEEQAVDLMRAA